MGLGTSTEREGNETSVSAHNPGVEAVQMSSEKNSGDDTLETQEIDSRYPSGIRLVFLTSGLVAVVLLVALDNYILGVLFRHFIQDIDAIPQLRRCRLVY